MRAILSAVPYVGGSLVELLGGRGQRIIEERRDEFLGLLSERLEVLDEQTIRRDFFETTEGFDLLVKALDESRKTRSRDKRELYARILAGAATISSENEVSSAEEYLYLISDLTLRELKVARRMYKVQKDYIKRYQNQSGKDPRQDYTDKATETWATQRDVITRDTGIDREELTQLVTRISSMGLIDVRYITFTASTVPTYWISPVFERLMRFVGFVE